MTFLIFIASALAVMQGFGLVEVAVPQDWHWVFGLRVKTALSTLLALVPALTFGDGPAEKLVYTFGLAGAAAFLHQVERLFSRSADVQQQAVIMRGTAPDSRRAGW